MDLLWLVFGFGVCFAVGYRGAMTYFRARAARIQIAEATPYELLSEDFTKTLLVLGDSTGVGVGASSPEESVAALLARHIGATYVENHAASGTAVEDLRGQIAKISRSHYDYILIQIGGNDIIMLRDASKSAKQLDLEMMRLPEAHQTLLMCAGNVGGATTFPLLMRPLHTLTTLSFHRWFAKVAKRRHATYVNLYEPPERDLFIKDPGRYLSEDGLHPSSLGYALWFEKLRAHLI